MRNSDTLRCASGFVSSFARMENPSIVTGAAVRHSTKCTNPAAWSSRKIVAPGSTVLCVAPSRSLIELAPIVPLSEITTVPWATSQGSVVLPSASAVTARAGARTRASLFRMAATIRPAPRNLGGAERPPAADGNPDAPGQPRLSRPDSTRSQDEERGLPMSRQTPIPGRARERDDMAPREAAGDLELPQPCADAARSAMTSLKGNLNSVDLANIFQMLSMNQREGTLYIFDGSSRKAI